MLNASKLLLLGLPWIAGCASQGDSPAVRSSDQRITSTVGGVTRVRALTADVAVEVHGLRAIAGETVTLHSNDTDRPAKVFLYERVAGRAGYGVYGLEGVKNDIEVPWPSDPRSIGWDDLDVRQAFERLLGIAGVRDRAAILEAEAGWLEADGATAVFLVPAPWEDSERGRRGPLILSHPLR